MQNYIKLTNSICTKYRFAPHRDKNDKIHLTVQVVCGMINMLGGLWAVRLSFWA